MIRFSHEAKSWQINLCNYENSKWHNISIRQARRFNDMGYIIAIEMCD